MQKDKTSKSNVWKTWKSISRGCGKMANLTIFGQLSNDVGYFGSAGGLGGEQRGQHGEETRLLDLLTGLHIWKRQVTRGRTRENSSQGCGMDTPVTSFDCSGSSRKNIYLYMYMYSNISMFDVKNMIYFLTLALLKWRIQIVYLLIDL